MLRQRSKRSVKIRVDPWSIQDHPQSDSRSSVVRYKIIRVNPCRSVVKFKMIRENPRSKVISVSEAELRAVILYGRAQVAQADIDETSRA